LAPTTDQKLESRSALYDPRFVGFTRSSRAKGIPGDELQGLQASGQRQKPAMPVP